MAVEMDNWTAENLVADWADKKVSSTAALMAATMVDSMDASTVALMAV